MLDILIILTFAVLYVMKAVRRVSADERIVIFRDGKPSSVAGPGNVFVWPGFQKSKQLNIRKQSVPLPRVSIAGFSNYSVIEGGYTYWISDTLRAASLHNVRQTVDGHMSEVLAEVISAATIRQCLLEWFTIERLVLDRVNERTKSIGVKVMDLTLTEFPAHRKVTSQLAGIIHFTLGTFAGELEQIADTNPDNGTTLRLPEEYEFEIKV